MEVKATVKSSTWFTINNNVFSTLGAVRIPCMSLVTSNNENKTDGLLPTSSHFSTHGSQVRCELANHVSMFGNWARTSQVHFNV